MSTLLRKLAFHGNGKPRGWVRKILFQRNQTPRHMFRRLVYKKNGGVRPTFEVWAKAAYARNNSASRAGQAGGVASNVQAVSAVLGAPPSMEEMARQWKKDGAPKQIMGLADLMGRLKSDQANRPAPLVFCFGHDNYIAVSGGVQMCIQREQKLLAAQGYDYLNVHPWQPLPRLAHLNENADPYVDLVLNGAAIGTCHMSSLIAAAKDLGQRGVVVDVIIHHLLGHSPEQVTELADAAKARKRLFWLHDFFSLCPSFTLQRNNVSFCNAPPLGSNACQLCLYGPERLDHQRRMAEFFKALSPQVLSPSAVTLEFWQAKSDLPFTDSTIAPHMVVEWAEKPASVPSDSSAPIVVGYLGHPVAHKGWPMFDALARAFSGSKKYEFVALGINRPDNPDVKWSKVRVASGHEAAMSEAIRDAGIDIVLHWPTWPETFSLTTYEALTGGAFVLTNDISGNVAATVTALDKGAVLSDWDAVLAFFSGDQAERLAQAARQLRGQTTVTSRMSDLSAPYLSKVE
jgi:hypothetical protein